MNEDILNEEDIPSDAFEDTEGEISLTCPRTGEEIRESVKAWSFTGFPDLTCWKVVASREMSPEDYINALYDAEEGKPPQIIHGFLSKAKKKFSAGLKLSEEEDKFSFYMPPAKESEHLCPKTKTPIKIGDKAYTFKGYPNAGFFKVRNGREMSVPDYLEIIKADGKPVFFKGFISKKKEKFDAELIFKDGKVGFNF